MDSEQAAGGAGTLHGSRGKEKKKKKSTSSPSLARQVPLSSLGAWEQAILKLLGSTLNLRWLFRSEK